LSAVLQFGVYSVPYFVGSPSMSLTLDQLLILLIVVVGFASLDLLFVYYRRRQHELRGVGAGLQE
jgi:hypothetical protein